MEKNEFTRKLFRDMNDAFESIGVNMLSDLHCAKLMGWLLGKGGGNEAVLFNVKLNEAIKIAQDRFNLHGGEVPNPEKFQLLKDYARVGEKWLNTLNAPEPDFFIEIEEYYGLRPKAKVAKEKEIPEIADPLKNQLSLFS